MVKRQRNSIHGVILLDKPTGVTSNKALQRIKHQFQAKKAGHTGSLDPLATGLLPLCFGQATKVSEYLLNSDKRYTTIVRLGQITDTLDAEGAIVETRSVAVDESQLQTAVDGFRGAIKQVPPMYSALKKDGQPLYKLARRGEIIERPARDMMVHSLQARRLDDFHVELEVHCSSGFYIRSLAHDLGLKLGCGAHVVELRRIAIKSIEVEQAHSLKRIEESPLDEILLPIDSLLSHFPKIDLSQAQADSLGHGRPAHASIQSGVLESGELSRFYAPDGSLFGMGEITADGYLKTHKRFVDC